MMLSFILSAGVILVLPTFCTASGRSGIVMGHPVKTELAAAQPLLQEKSYLKGNRRDRITQELIIDDGTDDSSSAYLKCYRTLEEVATSTLNQDAYIEFLQVMSDGEISVGGFQELPAVYAMIFYTAACVGQDDCTGDNVPEIDIGTTEEPEADLQLFCKQILKNTESTAMVAFEYSIRYDSSTLAEDTLANCLAEASVNILLTQLTTCVAAEGRRLLESNGLTSIVQRTLTQRQREQGERVLQALGSASSGAIDCDYSIETTVDRITDSGEFFCVRMDSDGLFLWIVVNFRDQ